MRPLVLMVFVSHVIACSKSESSETKAQPKPIPVTRVDWNKVFAEIPPPSGSDDRAKVLGEMVALAKAADFKWEERDGELMAVGVTDKDPGCSVALMVWGLALADRLKEAKIQFARCGDSVLNVAEGSVTEPPPPQPPKPTWEPFTSTNKMDDSQVIGTRIRADDVVPTIAGQSYRPALNIMCVDKKTTMRIDLGTLLNTETRAYQGETSYGWTSGVPLRLRLDQDKPMAQFAIGSTDGESAFLKNPVPVVKKMLGKTTLLVEYTPMARGPRTVTFTIKGIDEAIADVRKTCKW